MDTNTLLERARTFVFGDELDRGLLPKPIAYEEVHNEIQSILIPPVYPKGINVQVLQSINKSFALQHRVGLEPGQLKQTMFGPMAGPGNRYYSLGAVITHQTEQGGKYRLTGQYDPENNAGKFVGVTDVFGDGKTRVTVQAEDRASEKATEWAATLARRGDDYVATARVKNGYEAGCSYNQRLTSTSPFTIGGEIFIDTLAVAGLGRTAFEAAIGKKVVGGAGVGGPSLSVGKTVGKAGAPAPRPLDYAVGAAYDNGLHKTALHFASTGSFSAVMSLHHLFRVTERSTLASKFMLNCATGVTMSAVGYRMRFRNTLTTIHGMADSYGTIRLMIEREPVKDVRVGLSMEGRLSPGALAAAQPDGPITLGFSVSMGGVSRVPAPQSPCTLSRNVFSLT